jgi:hypothetical protein
MVLSSLGDGDQPLSPLGAKPLKKKTGKIKTQEIQEIRDRVIQKLSTCKTQREALEMEVNALSECVGLAIEIFNDKPVSDNSFQVTALVNAHKAALGQLEKMKDPTMILTDIEIHIRTMFTAVVKALAFEIDKTKRELLLQFPDEKATVEDMFARMMNSIQPETQNIYADLRSALKKILGIRG